MTELGLQIHSFFRPRAVFLCQNAAFSIDWHEVKHMLFALFLMLSLSLGLLLLSSLCRALLHASAVRRVGLPAAVVVGLPGDPLLLQRAAAAFRQNGFCHLERPGDVIVLDCGLSPQTRDACFAALGGRVCFLPPEALAAFLTAQTKKP